MSVKDEEERQSEDKQQAVQHLLMPLITRYTCLRRLTASTQQYGGASALNYVSSSKRAQIYPVGKQLFVSLLLLPLLFIFLLPSIRLDKTLHHDSQHPEQLRVSEASSNLDGTITAATSSDLLLAHLALLLRLPLDRVRLSAGLVGAAEAKSDHQGQHLQPDLLEEETHMQLLLPAEHRSSPGGISGSAGAAHTGGSSYLLSHYAPITARSPARTSADFGAYGGVAEAAAPVSVHGDPSGGASDYGDRNSGVTGEQQGVEMPPGQAVGSVEGESLSLGSAALQARADLPAVRALNVKCEKNHMTVNIIFDRPFYGTVFSKGHYNDQKCIHLPASSGQTSVNFDIHLGKCGVTSSDANSNLLRSQQQQQQQLMQTGAGSSGQQQPNGLYIENTIIIQYDPQVQEIYDQARKIRCTWYDYYEKSVSFRPYNVDMLDAVTANFLGDNIQCWMQIQVGKGPWSSEVAGIVKIGQTMTMVLAIKDDENRFDMLVRNCVAHDGKHQPIQLVDEYGCVARPKIMAKFQKVRNFGPAATVVSYAHFQAFKFPDSMSVNFQCVIQVCRYECPEPICAGSSVSPQAAGGIEGVNGPSGSSDYAVSGTEIVSSKEPVPGASHSYFLSNNSSLTGPGQTTVNVKLDELQGRAHVKLDTSMMAGTRTSNGAAALPPHLLHAGSSDTPSSGPAALPIGYAAPPSRGGSHSYLSASYYKPALSSGSLARTSATQAAQQQQQLAANGRPPTLHRAGSPMMMNPQFSPSYQSSGARSAQRSFPGNRLGELPLGDRVDAQQPDSAEANFGPAPAETTEGADPTSPALIGLVARPRGLHSIPVAGLGGATVGATQRQRRSVSELADTAYALLVANNSGRVQSQRKARGMQEQESTAVRTQKSIQVVSPDDVAFNLLVDDYEPLSRVSSSRRPSAAAEALMPSVGMVCFSGAKLLVGVLVGLSALVAGLLLAGYMMYLRERTQIVENGIDPAPEENKQANHVERPRRAALCSNLFSPSHWTATGSSAMHPALSADQQQQVAQLRLHEQKEHQRLMLARRQQEQQEEEIQQRNNYLARLYSQFMPATHWRQQH